MRFLFHTRASGTHTHPASVFSPSLDKLSDITGSPDEAVRPSFSHAHTQRNNVRYFPHFSTDQSGALSMPGHRCPLAASPGRRSQKHNQKRRTSAQCVQRIRTEVSTSQYTGVTHSPSNKQSKQQDSIPRLQTFSSECEQELVYNSAVMIAEF